MTKLYLKLAGQPAAAIEKDYFTVGFGAAHDLAVTGFGDGLLFVIQREGAQFRLIPGSHTLKLNGTIKKNPQPLAPLDRIEVQGQVLVCLDGVADAAKPGQAPSEDPFSLFAGALDAEASPQDRLVALLKALNEEANAETAYLLVDESSEGGATRWKVLSSYSARGGQLAGPELISNQVLGQALSQRTIFGVDSIVGHPLNQSLSLLDSKALSLAVVPLHSGTQTYGALYLLSRSPARPVRGARLVPYHFGLCQLVLSLLSQNQLRKRNVGNGASRPGGGALLFAAPVMTSFMERMEKLCQSDLGLLVKGETGTGKELVAKEIHRRSPRAEGPFVVVNCAAIPPTLLESTLFGHKKGSFTGATQDQPGKFALADKGTIFLDEIGEIPLDLQAKLLRVLQEKEVEAVGGSRPVKSDFRLISASHRDLQALVGEKKFREDLYFRLNGATLTVPALRERGDSELVLLAEHFLKKHGYASRFQDAAWEKLKLHPWPGNVRELEQTVVRAAVLATGDLISVDDIELAPVAPADQESLIENDVMDVRETKKLFLRRRVEQALQRTGGNRSDAARLLGVTERTVYRILATENSVRLA